MFGHSLDCGNDGDCAVNDPEQGNGLITAQEIDMRLPPNGEGNRSGGVNPIDTAAERKYVALIRVTLVHDDNRDGKADYSLSNDIAPPFLLLKQLNQEP
jgi:hypothetical protein